MSMRWGAGLHGRPGCACARARGNARAGVGKGQQHQDLLHLGDELRVAARERRKLLLDGETVEGSGGDGSRRGRHFTAAAGEEAVRDGVWK